GGRVQLGGRVAQLDRALGHEELERRADVHPVELPQRIVGRPRRVELVVSRRAQVQRRGQIQRRVADVEEVRVPVAPADLERLDRRQVRLEASAVGGGLDDRPRADVEGRARAAYVENRGRLRDRLAADRQRSLEQ